ncbi:SGNH/GDSL hydrolase family protein [Calycomorphotria hydatis]|uniref:GDSL-like Lipase/Acylhydrolase n=1 Tax=Calycomorphotria hydatis TaxID=2528027 RepID=A0A517T5N9_9PLAN|nr:SGNH/GDSL hydrolase family protein [Calycomorphotria hydatis]QDT63678.1 GDSL-like Lipase/Acylhydrolase [Calycomorphotria hydatis]
MQPAQAPWKTFLLVVGYILSILTATNASAEVEPLHCKRILFLGDSITYAGHYVAQIEATLRAKGVEPMPEIVNLGLSSETCSGLSEEDHPFPRPDVHTRLDRALEMFQPDCVVACYGMNDGIYNPFSEERFQKYQDGINLLKSKVEQAGAIFVVCTPPPFDPEPLRASGKLKPVGADGYSFRTMYADYDQVLARYSEWLLTLSNDDQMVIDLRTPVVTYLTEQRKKDPSYRLANDGIHLNQTGHSLMADAILSAWGEEPAVTLDPQLLKLAQQKMAVLRNAWHSKVGHSRPGVKAGLPLEEAEEKAAELTQQMNALLDSAN